MSSNFGFTGLASRQLQSGKSMMCAWAVVDKSVIFAELYPRILVLSQSLVHCARNCIVSMSMFV